LLERVESFSFYELVIVTGWITLIVVAARFIWIFPATYIPRWISPALARRDPAPPWQGPFTIGFVGVRGVVSLAAALAIPFTLDNGQPFPHRDLILFVTFGVIVITLVGQGLMLPWVLQWLGITRLGLEERSGQIQSELEARVAALEQVEKPA
jgi:CPA1 family monovalent cation:H+ antiporter